MSEMVSARLRPGTFTECQVTDCNGKHFSKGYCKSHHGRWARHGDPEKVVKGRIVINTDGTITCKSCLIDRLPEYFRPHRGRCKDCESDLMAPQKRRNLLRRQYNLTPEDYERQLEVQGGVCAICTTVEYERELVIDHDHETQENRGLLCHQCNTAIGLLNDNPQFLLRASRYLEEQGVWQS